MPGLLEVGGRLHHVELFGDGQPVVLLHGFTDDGACWSPVARSLNELGWATCAPDARGHGRTPLPDGEPFSAERRLQDAIEVVESTVGRAIFVGHSMGALTALLVAADRPDLVRVLVLVDPPLAGPLDIEGDDTKVFEAETRALAGMSKDALMEQCRRENPRWREEDIALWAGSKAQFDLRVFDRQHSWMGRPWRLAVSAVRCPLLVVAGEQDRGSAVSAEAVRWFRDSADAELTVVPGAGHSVHRDEPEAFLSALREFLVRISPEA